MTCSLKSSVKASMLTSTHNLPPAEANLRREKVSGDTPDPGRGASPPAPPIYEGMSGRTRPVSVVHSVLIGGELCGLLQLRTTFRTEAGTILNRFRTLRAEQIGQR